MDISYELFSLDNLVAESLDTRAKIPRQSQVSIVPTAKFQISQSGVLYSATELPSQSRLLTNVRIADPACMYVPKLQYLDYLISLSAFVRKAGKLNCCRFPELENF